MTAAKLDRGKRCNAYFVMRGEGGGVVALHADTFAELTTAIKTAWERGELAAHAGDYVTITFPVDPTHTAQFAFTGNLTAGGSPTADGGLCTQRKWRGKPQYTELLHNGDFLGLLEKLVDIDFCGGTQ